LNLCEYLIVSVCRVPRVRRRRRDVDGLWSHRELLEKWYFWKRDWISKNFGCRWLFTSMHLHQYIS